MIHNRVIRVREKSKDEMLIEKAGENAANHMNYILPIVLMDKFEFTFKRVTNLYERVIQTSRAYFDPSYPQFNKKAFQEYFSKKDIPIDKYVKSIPQSQKVFLTDMKKPSPLAIPSVGVAMVEEFWFIAWVLKEGYRFSNAKVDEFFRWTLYYIDSYARGYVNDNDIWQMICDECHWDIRKGEPV